MAPPLVGRYLYKDSEAQRTFEIVHLESQDKLLFAQSLGGADALTGVLVAQADGTWRTTIVGGSEPEEISLKPMPHGAIVRRHESETEAELLTISTEWRDVIDQPVTTGETMLVDAAPGSGKSTVLREWCRANPNSQIILLAYNRAVRDQLEKNFREIANVKAMTIHEAAYSATREFHHENVGDPTKKDWKKILEDIWETECEWSDVDFCRALLATFCASPDDVPHDPIKDLWDYFISGQCRVKMPHDVYLKIFQMKTDLQAQMFEPFDVVVVDEAQDCTDCMMRLIQSQPKAAVLACDPRQNICQFNNVTGEALSEMPVTHPKHLTMSFRFGPLVARFLSQIAGVQGFRIQGAPHINTQLHFDVPPWLAYRKLLSHTEKQKLTVLARKNATLFAEASAIATAKHVQRHSRICSEDRSLVRTMAVIGSYEKFYENVLQPVLDLYYMQLGQRTIEDFKCKCQRERDVEWLSKLAFLRDHGEAVPQIIEAIKSMMVDDTSEADVVLSTVHQAKGLGFRNVLLLDDFFEEIPVTNSEDSDLTQEERNILYVAASRVSSGMLMVGPLTSQRCRMLNFIVASSDDDGDGSDRDDEVTVSLQTPQSPQSADEDVPIEEIEHEEPPAVISPEEAQQVVEETWSQFVQQRALSAASTTGDATQSPQAMGAQSASCFQSSDAVSIPSVAQSAPGTTEMIQCLLPDARVLLDQGNDMHVLQLSPGIVLRTAQVGRPAIIRAVRSFQVRDRDMVSITFSSNEGALTGKLALTSSHVISARRPGGPAFRATLASELSESHLLRTNFVHDAKITALKSQVVSTAVVQIELENPRSSFFAADSGEGQAFIEVYGSLAPVKESVIKILTFYRCEKFSELFFKSPELQACRDALVHEGGSMDLCKYDLGPGKLVVSAKVAQQAVQALTLRSKILNASQVVVSADMEPVVRELVRSQACRANPVKDEEVLDLSSVLPRKTPRDRDACVDDLRVKRLRTERTFLDVGEPRPRSVVTRSTTDAHVGVAQNPRTFAPRLT